jgi:hypothetical protein
MKSYEILETESGGQIIKVTENEKEILLVPLDPANSDYAEYLRYTEWVEAGNDPDEFWTQTELTEMGEEI